MKAKDVVVDSKDYQEQAKKQFGYLHPEWRKWQGVWKFEVGDEVVQFSGSFTACSKKAQAAAVRKGVSSVKTIWKHSN